MATIIGTNGTDILDGTDEADRIEGGAGDDVIRGQDAGDFLYGGADNDLIEGGFGDDFIYDGTGDDEVFGGAGWDYFSNESGNDRLEGGTGLNSFVLVRSAERSDEVIVVGGSDNDGVSVNSPGNSRFDISLGASDDRIGFGALGGLAELSLGTGVDKIRLDESFGNSVGVGIITVWDFEAGSSGDGIDLLDFLGFNLTNWNSGSNPFASGHLRLVQEGTDALLQFDLDGGGDEFVTVITFANADATAFVAENLSGYPTGGTIPVGLELIGTSFEDDLTGAAGDDRIEGLDGFDILRGGAGDDSIEGGLGIDRLYGELGNDVLEGGAWEDTLEGGYGDDILDGGADADTMTGGAGDDIYVVDDAGDETIEAAGAGTDLVQSSISLTLGANLEDLTLTGNAALSGAGNALANVLTGNNAANVLNGNGGADRMVGLGGNDTYFVDNAGDLVIEETGGGTDRILSSVSYTLRAGVAVETLSTTNAAGTAAISFAGNELANILYGNAGANVLNGNGGADQMAGYGGNDIYYVDNSLDLVAEAAGAGTDRILASVSYALRAGAHVETLSTTNVAGTDAINLGGNELANILYGNAGANTLNGNGGIDQMAGYGGNDVYFVDQALDLAFESVGGGSDRVYASVSYALRSGSEVEIISTTNNAGTAAINLGGNEFAQILYGNAGANVLNGGGGADTLSGFGGNDQYFVDQAGDLVFEAAGGGSDRIFASVSYTLAAGVHVEILSTTNNAGTAAINLTGNELANTIYGNAGANVLNGGAGADILSGFGGADTFAFTTALGGGNVDWIVQFEVGIDEIALDDAVFTGLGLGALSAAAFHTGSAAADADDRIVYDAATGALYFDADGSGAGAALQFARLSTGLALGAGDFVVI